MRKNAFIGRITGSRAYEETRFGCRTNVGRVAGRSPGSHVQRPRTFRGRHPTSAVASPIDRRDLRGRNDGYVLQRIQWPEQWRLRQRAGHRRQQRAAGIHPALRGLPATQRTVQLKSRAASGYDGLPWQFAAPHLWTLGAAWHSLRAAAIIFSLIGRTTRFPDLFLIHRTWSAVAPPRLT
jgi:hypothetical protein